MPPQLNAEQVRDLIIQDLNIGHLSKKEQDEIIEGLNEVLQKRATIEVLKHMPESAAARLSALIDAEKQEEAQKFIREMVPNAQDIVIQAMRDGIQEHKKRVIDLVESGAATP